MTEKKLSFEEFQATRVFCPDGKKHADRDVLENVEDMGGDGPVPVLLYDGSLMIVITTSEMRSYHYADGSIEPRLDHTYYLFIENQQWSSDDLEELERHLYEFYLI